MPRRSMCSVAAGFRPGHVSRRGNGPNAAAVQMEHVLAAGSGLVGTGAPIRQAAGCCCLLAAWLEWLLPAACYCMSTGARSPCPAQSRRCSGLAMAAAAAAGPHKAWDDLKPERAEILCKLLDIPVGADAVAAFKAHARAQQPPSADTAKPAWKHDSFGEERHAKWVCQTWGLMDGGKFKDRILGDPRSVEPPKYIGTLESAPLPRGGCYGAKGAGKYTVWCAGCRKWTGEASWEAHCKKVGTDKDPGHNKRLEQARQNKLEQVVKNINILGGVTKRMKTEAGQLLFWAKPDSRVAERYKNEFKEEMLLPEHATATMLETRRVTFDDFKERQSPKQDKLEWKPDSGKYCEDSLEGWEGDRKNKADGGIPWMRNSILSETQPWGGITQDDLTELKLDQDSKPNGWDEADFLKVIDKAKAKISKFWSEKAEEILKQATPATGQ
jgi:hypothetical protein